MNDEKNIKQQIIKSAEAVKKKVQQMKNNKLDSEIALQSMFKPVTDPLKQLARKNSSAREYDGGYQDSEEEDNTMPEITLSRKRKLSVPTKISDDTLQNSLSDINFDQSVSDSEFEQNSKNNTSDLFFETSDGVSTPTPQDISSWSLSSEVFKDIPYGIRIENGKPMIGTERVTITDNEFIVAGHSFNRTRGLSELLYQRKPDLRVVTEDDKQIYKSMLLLTNAHKRKYDLNQPINSNRGFKYLEIIKPLLSSPSDKSNSSTAKGKGLPLFKEVGKSVDYIFWNDPNDLVKTLKLLIASRDAGNTGLDDEILSVMKELRTCVDIE